MSLLLSLPDECLLSILEQCAVDQLGHLMHVGCTCKRLCDLTIRDDIFWHALFIQITAAPLDLPHCMLRPKRWRGRSWRDCVKRLHKPFKFVIHNCRVKGAPNPTLEGPRDFHQECGQIYYSQQTISGKLSVHGFQYESFFKHVHFVTNALSKPLFVKHFFMPAKVYPALAFHIKLGTYLYSTGYPRGYVPWSWWHDFFDYDHTDTTITVDTNTTTDSNYYYYYYYYYYYS